MRNQPLSQRSAKLGVEMMQQYDAAWYRSVLDAMHDMVLVKGPQSNLLWANRAFLTYYGMTESELRQIVDAPHSDPDDTLQYIKDDMTVLETGQPLDISQEAVTDAAGDSRYFHTIKTPMVADGTLLGSVGMSRLLDDTTIPKRHLDHNDAKAFVAPIRSLAESFPNPMLMVDIRQRVISASPLWTRYFGDADIAPGSRFKETYPALIEMHANLTSCLADGATVEEVVSHIGPGGVPRMFTARICPWEYSDGTIGGATIIATDVTSLYDQSAKLKKRNDELMQFSYRASHDLKGPLSTSKGLAQFIAEDIAAGDLEQASLNAGRIVDLMSKLEQNIGSFLSLARSDVQGEADETVDLEQMVHDICTGHSLHIDTSGVLVKTEFQLRTLFAQRARIGQILENLISNAIKYINPETPEKFVKVYTRAGANNRVLLLVEDNGCGIPADVGPRIFDLFSRFHEGSEGTGLGLAIVKKHVDALNGEITVEDTGNGTRFCVSLPQIELEMAS